MAFGQRRFVIVFVEKFQQLSEFRFVGRQNDPVVSVDSDLQIELSRGVGDLAASVGVENA